MTKSWSDTLIMDDRTGIVIALTSTSVQLLMFCTTDFPIMSAWFAAGSILAAAHLQIQRNDRKLSLLAARLLTGHACEQCFEHEGRWYCFYRDFVKGGR